MINRRNEAGNAIFLILIAVALFAALFYAVMQSSRSGTEHHDANEGYGTATISQYPVSVRKAIDRMIANGITVEQMNFDPPAAFGSACYEGPTVCVFHPDGGGAIRLTTPPGVMTESAQGEWVFSAQYEVDGIGITAGDETSTEVIAFLPGISQSVCNRLNEELGVPNNPEPADDDGIPFALATTVPDKTMEKNTENGLEIGYTETIGGSFKGQPFSCADFSPETDEANDSDLAYYYVLMER